VEVALKLSPLSCALACSLALFLPRAGSSQDTIPSRLHTVATGTDFVSIGFAADSIVKEDGPTRYDSLIHLRGNVEIRTCCVQLPGGNQVIPGNPNQPRAYMIMRADEADYDGEKSEIEARGTVRVSFQKPN
jgi:lipopolysaccharide assembly outer membrane protein LptD (OstA)